MADGIILQSREAAATLVVGTDVYRNERKSVSSRPRVVTGIAMVGGNAIAEASIDLYIEDVFLGTYYTSLNGAVAILLPDHYQPIAPRTVAPGSKIAGIIATAPTVSPLITMLFGREL